MSFHRSLHLSVLYSISVAIFLLIVSTASGYASTDSRLITAGPLFDYRSSAAVDYATLHLAGPLIKWERKKTERESAFRPIFYRSVDPARDAALVDVLFPLFRYRRDRDMVEWNFLALFRYEGQNYSERQRREYKLFPFYEYGSGDGRPTSYAVFPLAAHVYNWFGRVETKYLLFPLWSQTRHHSGMQVDNVLWPFFARISGADPAEWGFKAWPLTGYADRPGYYEKFFLLWPFWISYDTELNTENPRHRRYVFPLWLYSESTQRSERTVLWPFFSYIDDRDKGYTEWNFPWPLLTVAKGEYRHGVRILPFYSDLTTGTSRTRWYLWPVYRQETVGLGTINRARDTLFFLLYTDIEETAKDGGEVRLHRRLLWPLFGYRQSKGVSHFYTLALLEPLFPESDGIERNWSPLWRIYQAKWDQSGNRVDNLLWNLYWRERGPTGLAWEVFPLFFYFNEIEGKTEWSFLKGLLRYRSTPDQGKKLHLFYLPWGIPLGTIKTPPVTD